MPDASKEKPTVYILHGNDAFEIKRFIDNLVVRMGDAGIADLNTTRLDGSRASLDELVTTTTTMPFLADRRLVILTNPLNKLENAAARTRFLNLLDHLPPSTALVLVIEDEYKYKKGKKEWDILKDTHWLQKWSDGAGKRVMIQEVILPNQAEMPAWIIKEAKEQGGQFEPGAAVLLANQVENNTQIAYQEIKKILTYCNFERPAGVDDVRELAVPIGQADVFGMVDAIASGDSPTALRMLHLLLEEQEPSMIFGMVVRQFRLLLEAREILDEGGTASAIASKLRQPPFVAEKLNRQASRFSMQDLSDIYHRLLELDEAVKTSKSTLELGLDILVAELSVKSKAI